MDLQNYFTLNTSWARKGIFTLTEANNMLPYERLIYLDVINAQIEREIEEIERLKRK